MIEAFASGLLILALWFGPFILAEYLCLPGSETHERKQAALAQAKENLKRKARGGNGHE